MLLCACMAGALLEVMAERRWYSQAERYQRERERETNERQRSVLIPMVWGEGGDLLWVDRGCSGHGAVVSTAGGRRLLDGSRWGYRRCNQLNRLHSVCVVVRVVVVLK